MFFNSDINMYIQYTILFFYLFPPPCKEQLTVFAALDVVGTDLLLYQRQKLERIYYRQIHSKSCGWFSLFRTVPQFLFLYNTSLMIDEYHLSSFNYITSSQLHIDRCV